MKKKNLSSLQSLPNIGPAISKRLENIGIHTREEFLARDPFEIFDDLCIHEPDLCRCALAAIVGANVGAPWNKIMKMAVEEYEKKYPRKKWGKC